MIGHIGVLFLLDEGRIVEIVVIDLGLILRFGCLARLLLALRYGAGIFQCILGFSKNWHRCRLEYCWFLCERIDALPRLCGRLLDHNQFGEAGHKKGSRFLELFVTNFGERLDDALDVLSRDIVFMLLSNFLNELRLRHQLRHLLLLRSNQPAVMLA
jgi:hypothetical protein